MIDYLTIKEQDYIHRGKHSRSHSTQHLYSVIKDHINWYNYDFNFNTDIKYSFEVNDTIRNRLSMPFYYECKIAVCNHFNDIANDSESEFNDSIDSYDDDELVNKIPDYFLKIQERMYIEMENVLKTNVFTLFKNDRDMHVMFAIIMHPSYKIAIVNSFMGSLENYESPFSINFLNSFDGLRAFVQMSDSHMTGSSGFNFAVNANLLLQTKHIKTTDSGVRFGMYCIILSKMHAEEHNIIDEGIIMLNALQIYSAFNKSNHKELYA